MVEHEIIFNRGSLESLLAYFVPFEYTNNQHAVNVQNIKLLASWAVKNDIPENVIFNGLSQSSMSALFDDSDLEHITNAESVRVFENIGSYIAEEADQVPSDYSKFVDRNRVLDPSIFRVIAREVVEKNIKSRLASYTVGRTISDLVEFVRAMNSKLNKTKFIDVETEKMPDGTYKTYLAVTPLPGLYSPDCIREWNVGIYDALVYMSQDEIIKTEVFPDDNGGWKYCATYQRKKDLASSVIQIFSLPARKKISQDLFQNLAQVEMEQNRINRIIVDYSELINSSLERLEVHNERSAYHSLRTAFAATLMGRMMRLPNQEVADLFVSGLLHDRGKGDIPVSILDKPGKLDRDEWNLMMAHSALSAYPLVGREVSGYRISPAVLTAILEHHERADGTGYPFGIKAEQTQRIGLILQIMDVFDAIREERPYKKAFSYDKIRAVIGGMSADGKFYEPYAEFFLDHTLPLLESINYGHESFNMVGFSGKKSQSDPIRRFISYLKGYSREFDVDRDIIHPSNGVILRTDQKMVDDVFDYLVSSSDRLPAEYQSILVPYIQKKRMI